MSLEIEKLRFDERGLVPCIVQDYESGRVLTLAYMSRESLRITLEKRLSCFWSRSRKELWLKGKSSGNYQHVVRIEADCDGDALLLQVKKEGPACHLGTDSCFDTEQRTDFLKESGAEGAETNGSEHGGAENGRSEKQRTAL